MIIILLFVGLAGRNTKFKNKMNSNERFTHENEVEELYRFKFKSSLISKSEPIEKNLEVKDNVSETIIFREPKMKGTK